MTVDRRSYALTEASRIGLLALAGLLALLSATPPAEAGKKKRARRAALAAAAQLESVQLLSDPEGAVVELTADRPITWTATSGADRTFAINLLNTVPGPDLTNLASAEGTVESVVFTAESRDGGPATIATVTTRDKTAHSVNAEGAVLRVKVLGAAPSTAAAAPASTGAGPALTAQPAAVPPSAAPPNQAYSAQAQYTINAGDLISVDVFGHDDFDRDARVQDDGKIALPLVGRIPVGGLTVEQAELQIERSLREAQLLANPEVFVAVEEYASYGVTIQGAVLRPGIYPIVGRKGLLELIWAAGGLAESAEPGQKILVVRQLGPGRQQRFEVDAERLVDLGDMSLNMAVLPGDNVVVPKAKRLRAYVSGAVERPGPVDFSSGQGLTVLQAITLAGGPSERANLGKVVVIRQHEDGTQETIKVNVKKIQKGKAQDVFLQNNDTVRVAVWFF